MQTIKTKLSKSILACLLLLAANLGTLAVPGASLAGGSENLTKTIDTSYQPESEAIGTLQQVDQPIEIVLFHGSWCSDCKREVPRFMRVLELADNPQLQLVEYEVNYDKEDVMGMFRKYNVEFIPTIIFLSDGKELGRIIQDPKQSLEADSAAILAGL